MSLAGYFSKVSKNCFFAKSAFGYNRGVISRCYSIWEPDYVTLAKTKTPEYDIINVQIKGYDFAVLERYQELIRRIARVMKINIVKTWAAPHQDLLVHHYKPNSVNVEYKYDLKLSERNVQVVDVKSHIMSLFLEAVATTCPPGVDLSVHPHEEVMEESRYVPNLLIKELEEALEDVGSTGKKKKTKDIIKTLLSTPRRRR